MKDWIFAFFMAWGMFLAIPCPFPRWRESARGKMLTCLPLTGVILGALWALAGWLLSLLSVPDPLSALILAVFPWLATGFIHLDGFMDVCDAVLSRRDLETRQKILKDSHCGAFAVISMVLLGLAQWSVCFSFPSCGTAQLLPLAAIPVAGRAAAALAVSHLRPMRTSQYAGQAHPPLGRTLFLCLLLLAAIIAPLMYSGFFGFAPLAAALVYALSVRFGFRQLDGMSGDISGFALTLGELAGLAVLFFLR